MRRGLGWIDAMDDETKARRWDAAVRQLHDVAELCAAMNGGSLPDWISDRVRVERALQYVDSHAGDQVADQHRGAEIARRLRAWYRQVEGPAKGERDGEA